MACSNHLERKTRCRNIFYDFYDVYAEHIYREFNDGKTLPALLLAAIAASKLFAEDGRCSGVEKKGELRHTTITIIMAITIIFITNNNTTSPTTSVDNIDRGTKQGIGCKS
ncbi:uncharacterized protein LOC131998164 [Stomoxys calcitrans]|uniref:uncharacterized protein LOC131998164 n=1 Tax=Stomoxys calcitrans TaxID=35570 RepID=UPI0027E38328|nr:uncharacterized protein LOC131998164 [Stomoxys calcitrans]